jgi:hypothetical protein
MAEAADCASVSAFQSSQAQAFAAQAVASAASQQGNIAGHNNSPNAHAALFGNKTRQLLVNDLDLYVSSSGNDANTGEASSPLRTVAAAFEKARKTDQAGWLISIICGAGEQQWPAIGPGQFTGTVRVLGDSNIAARVKFTNRLSVTFGNNLFLHQVTGIGFTAELGGYLQLNNVSMQGDENNLGYMVHANGGTVILSGSLVVSGQMHSIIRADYGRVIGKWGGLTIDCQNVTLTLVAAVYANFQALVYLENMKFTGTVTGQRYYAQKNSLISVSLGGPYFIPGTVDGNAGNGGLYV